MTTFIIIVLSLLLAAATTALVLVLKKKDQTITELLREEQAIVEEERRMFGFLHDLGESITREDSNAAMYRLIVEGTMRVLECSGGALYLLDPAGKSLVPRFHSDHCAPLVDLPERIAAMGKTNGSALLSFLRLHSLRVDEGIAGGVFASQKAELIEDLRKDIRLKQSSIFQNNITAMVGPLSFGPRKLGILAVTAPKGARQFRDNDFDVFKSIVEQSAFALANAMAHQAAAEKKQIEAELRAASEIQRILLPESDPSVPSYTITGRNIPAKVLSGDYYDFIPLGEGRQGVVIADVSGKGTAAAIITAMCRSILRSNASIGSSPAAVLAAVNRQLAPDIREDMFISMIYLVIDPGTDSVTFARAGHTLPLLWRKATGNVESLHSGGLAVGIDKGDVFERVTKDKSFQMEPGDCLLLYTDGVNEALDAKGLEFGEERIHTNIATLAPQGPQALVDGIVADVDKFLGGKRSHDDITLIALQKKA
ncbi:Serine phosphatase RsbU, regulator of sigma subunit [Prosthecobacter debontii]|uniref:Serine phosphatase RsbU, regulator of sigma subunit n=1 Tax=Prosthecobacter debontii TaxID=48467 RepID=A0A1T4WFX7_9BACT|nr:GAF domain-containing SpoIIE family protein phosphatase [Prosthecobacter debontii]SKA76097.1 Serine phosphatase RsbU, regulator of sigma subunit [Prosthecobacter debontii]